MKRIFLILCILSCPIFLFGQQWIDDAGSTWTATAAGVEWEIKDIQNNVHDRTHNAWTVYNISSGPYHDRNWIYDTDISAWIRLKVSSMNSDAEAITEKGSYHKAMQYALYGNTFVRLMADGLHYQYVRSSTDSVASIYYNGFKAEVQEDGELRVETSSGSLIGIYKDGNTADVDTDDELHVETSTDSTASIYYNGNKAVIRNSSADANANTEQGLVTQSNMHALNGGAWQRLLVQATPYHNLRVAVYNDDKVFEINDWDSDDQATSRNAIVTYTNLYGYDEIGDDWDRLRSNLMKYLWVVTSSESWTRIAQGSVTLNGGNLDEVKRVLESSTTITNGEIDQVNRVLESSGVINNFPTDYPDSTAQSSLSNIDTNTENTYNQLKTSVTTSDINYSGKVSTGTSGKIFASASIAITNYSMEAYSFYSVGNDTTITSTWHDGIIYALEGIPVTPQKLSIPISNPTFQCTLPADTTLYYILHGVQ